MMKEGLNIELLLKTELKSRGTVSVFSTATFPLKESGSKRRSKRRSRESKSR